MLKLSKPVEYFQKHSSLERVHIQSGLPYRLEGANKHIKKPAMGRDHTTTENEGSLGELIKRVTFKARTLFFL